MKHYRAFRITMEIINTIIMAAGVAAFAYFAYNMVALIPIFE